MSVYIFTVNQLVKMAIMTTVVLWFKLHCHLPTSLISLLHILFFCMFQQQSSTCAFDVMSILLDWICDAHLRYSITEQPTRPVERFSSTEYIQEKVFKVSITVT